VLSAQTTDLAVNRVTRNLFALYPDAASLARAPPEHVRELVKSIGLWQNKAANIQALAQALVERHGGHVPPDLDALTELPGVGRKTATAVLGTAFGAAAGITVDTHMLRINRLLRLSTREAPEAMARDLERLIPSKEWPAYTHRIIDHGRLVCVANRPRCGICPLAAFCPNHKSVAAGYMPELDTKEPASAKGLSWLAWEA
jgi:endonuclease-3